MAMREDFCAFILTHGRPDGVRTFKTLERSGYTGKVFIVIDDEDTAGDDYRRQYGDKVLTFCREDAFAITDDGDNFGKNKGVVYARNVCWELARRVGVNYFIVLDDDYGNFALRWRSDGKGIYQAMRTTLDSVLEQFVTYLKATPAVCVALSQGGDLIGGTAGRSPSLKRKAMNAFVCATERPFAFVGHINEDVNAYVTLSRQGVLFFTVMQAQLVQATTQKNAGGLTEFYLDVGTYVKTFYSVMYAPSCVRIATLGDSGRWDNPQHRIHHKINWHRTAPKILREQYKKPRNIQPRSGNTLNGS